MATQPLTNLSATATATSSLSSGSSNSSSSGSSDSGSDGMNSSATLYLYTFLATLVLLLSVSAAIVVRSYLIRRRQRQLIADAIRDGIIPNAPGPGVTLEHATLLARRPELFDVYLGHAPAEREKAAGKGKARESTSSAGSVGGGWWNAVMPVAAREVRTAPNTAGKTQPSHAQPPRPPPVLPSTFARLRQQLRAIVPMPSVGASILPAPATSADARQPEVVELSPPRPPSPTRSSGLLDVAFLVAMPAPHHESHHVEQEFIPYVEFGIARVSGKGEVRMDQEEAP
ncbi:uncharacterized protein C8Q71DRAFT_547643 [Rhodofomes roseus]|uniref:Uncharacterized protein n=1 Tax=Rhodofomes roseus TaxID=34475 RepID=A0ABQ8KID0_9APHY|nr:uncharacterized protein C8Q71DRAFT_547643 [Rhodofomes roseus]KAH9837540.1 hypothetical protein C8Q71DRAFT_547643 [Rhodofomes roseus]